MDLDGLLHEHLTEVWHHDKSAYYSNDLHKIRWVHKGEGAIPYANSEGVSLMAVDFILDNYVWLCSPGGSQQAQVLFKAGKAQEGYLMNDDILLQATKAMDILQEHYPSEKHVFVLIMQ